MFFVKKIGLLTLTGSLALWGCLPPKTIITLPQVPITNQPQLIVPGKQFVSEEQIQLERLIRRLEETEQRLFETQQRAEEALRKVERASEKTDAAAERIQRAQEKIKAVEREENP